MYNKLLEKEIIPEIKRENPDELSIDELKKIAEKLDEKVSEYDKKSEECEVGSERKKYRSERKYPKQGLKSCKEVIKRKEKYAIVMKIIGAGRRYLNNNNDAT